MPGSLVRDGSHDAAMQNAIAIQQVFAQGTLDGHPINVLARYADQKAVLEGHAGMIMHARPENSASCRAKRIAAGHQLRSKCCDTGCRHRYPLATPHSIA